MSINALEKALWQSYTVPESTAAYGVDPAAYASGFALTPSEQSMLVNFEVMPMIEAGANPMLVMMAFQTLMGMERFPEYIQTVNAALMAQA